MRLRGQLQAAQALAAQPGRQPSQGSADLAAFQRLLERPQAIALRGRAHATAHQQQPAQVEPCPCQRPGRGFGGRIEQHHQPAGMLRRHQARGQQADFTDTRVWQQQFGHAPPRPAATRQLGIEHGKPSRHRRIVRAAQLMAEPERRMQRFQRLQTDAGSRERA